jgi:hypothetical protein
MGVCCRTEAFGGTAALLAEMNGLSVPGMGIPVRDGEGFAGVILLAIPAKSPCRGYT